MILAAVSLVDIAFGALALLGAILVLVLVALWIGRRKR